MSRSLCVLLEADRVWAMPADGSGVTEFAWAPEAPDALVAALRAAYGAPRSIIVIIGLSLLEIAQPSLPPVANDARVRMLERDSDRFFAVREPAAVATDGDVAFATSSAPLSRWTDALGRWATVRAVLTVAQAAALSGDGAFTLPLNAQETGSITIADGRVREARRVRASTSAREAKPGGRPARVLTLADVTMGAHRAADGPADLQLLDASARMRVMQQRSRAWWRAAAMTVSALFVFVWSANRWRDRQLVALEREVQSLTQSAANVRAAQSRLQRAYDERALLVASEAERTAPNAPAAVLARLGSLLPKDAFIQRLEWNGSEWRIDGSAADAAALVPLLDADAQFDGVRSAAPSTRYVEAGRARSSFSIVFTSPDRAVSRGAP